MKEHFVFDPSKPTELQNIQNPTIESLAIEFFLKLHKNS